MDKPERKIHEIVEKSFEGEPLSHEEMIALYRVDSFSREAFFIRWAALKQSMELSGGVAEIHAQIGLDSGPCPKDCQFCSFASCNNANPRRKRATRTEDVLDYARIYEEKGANLILLLMTEAYEFDKLLEMCARTREAVSPDMPLLANTGDLTLEKARQLKAAGVNGIYHAVRLGEGVVTGIAAETRLDTMANAQQAGLKLSTCLEPIGPEHGAEEIADIAKICMDARPMTSGVGRRVAVEGTKTAVYGMLSQPQNALYAAAYRLADHHTKLIASAHSELMANSGSNLAWSEVGSNPRDRHGKTEKHGMGRTMEAVAKTFREAGWEVRKGGSPGWTD
jgi:biotin synthase